MDDAFAVNPDDLRQLEKERLRSLVDRDFERARELHADDYQLISPGGATYSKAEYLDGIESGDLDYIRFEPISEIAVLAHEDVAVLRYRVAIEIRFAGGLDTDEFWHTDVYERRDGRWQAVWSHATRIRRPAG